MSAGYRLRAAYLPDVHRFEGALAALGIEVEDWDVTESGIDPDVELAFSSSEVIEVLWCVAGTIPNGHVMLETLETAADYTGKRVKGRRPRMPDAPNVEHALLRLRELHALLLDESLRDKEEAARMLVEPVIVALEKYLHPMRIVATGCAARTPDRELAALAPRMARFLLDPAPPANERTKICNELAAIARRT